MKTGEDVTREFQEGAGKCLALAMEYQIDEAILQSRSPSCGVKQIYDGTFTGRKIDGHGVFAGMLLDHGFRVIDLEDLEMEKRN